MALTSSTTPSNTFFERECREIHTSFDSPGQLAVILAHRTPAERQQIKENYKAMYNKDLVDHLQEQQNVPVCAALYLWMLEPQVRDAVVAHSALERSEVDYRALVEIYARRKSNQLFFTKQVYLSKFRRHLDQEIVTEASHSYQRILAALATSHRSHNEEVSQHIAKCDAMKLYGAIRMSTGGIDEATILEIFSKRSVPQLRLAFSSYKQIYGHDFSKTLKREDSIEFEESLRVVIQCMCDPTNYYSEMIFSSLKGEPTAKRVLIRVMMTGSADVGIEKVSAVFEKNYGMKMQDAIRENVEDGDYRDFLLALSDMRNSH
ncbi:uncharacterized protein A4U43_C05F16850 [Asparagus officinalis]|uniref:Annexin n=1 Tax=Asparagus officinalis TaxID=4686 RepID=A0A5P1ES40_ASPOF|nr:annexin D8-like [Asparagus officinalis]ONK68865.1 uncharacterized protein A4U43_C05F16850 [Asparagus officinalis]